MNVLDKYIIRRMNNSIIEGFNCKNSPQQFAEYKRKINNEYGIFFYNIMKTNNRDVYTIMAKRKSATYRYSLNISTKELILKGERRNASS